MWDFQTNEEHNSTEEHTATYTSQSLPTDELIKNAQGANLYIENEAELGRHVVSYFRCWKSNNFSSLERGRLRWRCRE